jgi:integrating conjugative element protein (TIGR03758 family)
VADLTGGTFVPRPPAADAGSGGSAGQAPSAMTWNPLSSGEAFYRGAGLDFEDLGDFITRSIALALCLWTAWVAQAHYAGYRNGRLDLLTLQANVLKATLLTLLVLIYTLP